MGVLLGQFRLVDGNLPAGVGIVPADLLVDLIQSPRKRPRRQSEATSCKIIAGLGIHPLVFILLAVKKPLVYLRLDRRIKTGAAVSDTVKNPGKQIGPYIGMVYRFPPDKQGGLIDCQRRDVHIKCRHNSERRTRDSDTVKTGWGR